MRFHAADEVRVLELAATLAFAADHLDDLPAPGDQFAEPTRGFVRQRPRLRLDGLGEARDRLRVQPIGLGQPAGGAGEVADLARVDDHQRQAGGAECRGDGRLEAARGFEQDELRRQPRQALGQSREPVGLPADGEGLARRTQMHIEPILGDIDADEHRILARTAP